MPKIVLGLDKLMSLTKVLRFVGDYLETLPQDCIVNIWGTNVLLEGTNRDELWLFLKIDEKEASAYFQLVKISPQGHSLCKTILENVAPQGTDRIIIHAFMPTEVTICFYGIGKHQKLKELTFAR